MTVFSQKSFSQQDDFQLWSAVNVNARVEDSNFIIQWVAENRLQNNASDFRTFLTIIGFQYEAKNWLSVGFFYRVQKDNNRAWKHAPYPELSFQVRLGQLNLFNRNRFQTFISPEEDTEFQYRNFLRLSHSFVVQDFRFTPFIFEEVFLGSGGEPFSQVRLGAGNVFGFLKNKFSLSLYYLFRTRPDEISFWQRDHILATSFKVSF